MIAVDQIIPKSPKVMVTKLDLTQFATQQLIVEWIRMQQVKTVFCARPCGTASLASTIHLEGFSDLPQPLRTLEQPDGVDELEGWNFLRVERSNILYDFVAAISDECARQGKIFIRENPKKSLFWHVTPWMEREEKQHDVGADPSGLRLWVKQAEMDKVGRKFSGAFGGEQNLPR